MQLTALNKRALLVGVLLLSCATAEPRLRNPIDEAVQYVAEHQAAIEQEARQGHGEHLRTLAAMGECGSEYDLAQPLRRYRNSIPRAQKPSPDTHTTSTQSAELVAAEGTVALWANAPELHCEAWQKNRRRRPAGSKSCYPRRGMAQRLAPNGSFHFTMRGVRPHYGMLGAMKCQ